MNRRALTTAATVLILIGLTTACGTDHEASPKAATAATSIIQASTTEPTSTSTPTRPATEETSDRDPASTDTSSPAPTVPTAPFPSELVDRWVGPPRALGAIGTGTAAAFVEITNGFLVLQTGIADNPKVFDSTALATNDHEIQLQLSADDGNCHTSDIGHYTWALSSHETTLTLTPVDDACQLRADALAGNWTHTACNDHGRDCLGAIEAGTYSTNRFNPFGGFTYGQLTFDVPDGWAVALDAQAGFFLRRAADYTAHIDTFYGLTAWADVAAAAQDCSDQPDPSIGLGSANIAAWMMSLPSVHATRQTISLNGRTAEVIDADIAPDANTCQGFVSLIASRTSKPDPFNFGIFGTQHMRIYLVDVADQRTVAIFIDDNGQTFDDLATALTPIITSFTFSATPPTG